MADVGNAQRPFRLSCTGHCRAGGRGARRGRAVAFVLLVVCLLAPSASAAHVDRVERRARELALPDPLLDPSWPDLGPSRSDSAPAEDRLQEESEPGDEEGLDESRSADGKVQPPADIEEPGAPLETVPHPDGTDGFEPDPSEW